MVTVNGSQNCYTQANVLWQRAFGDVVSVDNDNDNHIIIIIPYLVILELVSVGSAGSHVAPIGGSIAIQIPTVHWQSTSAHRRTSTIFRGEALWTTNDRFQSSPENLLQSIESNH